MKRIALAATVFAAIAAIAASSRANIDGDSFQRELWGWTVSMRAPKNWSPSEERSYPSILLWLVRRDPPGKMLLSAEQLEDTNSASDYAEHTTKLLEALGFTVRKPQLHAQTGAYWIDFDNGEVYLRQAFLVIGDVGYALTLSARNSRTRGQHLRAFDFALRSIKIKRGKPIQKLPAADAGPESESDSESEPENDEPAVQDD
jgi:hypothetical protein